MAWCHESGCKVSKFYQVFQIEIVYARKKHLDKSYALSFTSHLLPNSIVRLVASVECFGEVFLVSVLKFLLGHPILSLNHQPLSLLKDYAMGNLVNQVLL